MSPHQRLTSSFEKIAFRFTKWIGSGSSLMLHSVFFLGGFMLSYLGYVSFDRMLLVVTTLVSLEAIYLSIFIQFSLNHAKESLKEVEEDVEGIQEDVAEIQENIGELQEDVVEMTEEERADSMRKEEQKEALVNIQEDLEKLTQDIARLRSQP